MHHNPVNGKWQLVDDYIDYPYSSVLYYEKEKKLEISVADYRKIHSGSPADDPEGV